MPAEIPQDRNNNSPKYIVYQATMAGALIGTLYTSLAERKLPIAWHANTGAGKKSSMDDNTYVYNAFNNNNRQFIQLEQSFSHQLDQNADILNNQNPFILKEKMKISSDAILNFCPDRISLELTNEGSIFYTFSKDGLIIYLQHFLIDEHDDTDEAIISIFKGDENLLNFGGSLVHALTMASNYLTPKSLAVLEFA